jgi:hypothetical protein
MTPHQIAAEAYFVRGNNWGIVVPTMAKQGPRNKLRG